MRPAGRIEGSKQMLTRGSSLGLLSALTLLALPFLPVRCLASDGKWTLDVGASRTPPLMQGFGASEFASMGVIRSISQHVGLQVRTSYRFPRGSAVRADFLPIGLGIRFFGDPHPLRQSGLFIEALPSLIVSRWADSRGSLTAVRPGYQIGAGFQVPIVDHAALELGMVYVSSRDFVVRDRKIWALPIHPGLDDLAFHAAVAVGI